MVQTFVFTDHVES